MKYKLLRFSLFLFVLLTGGTNAIKATTYEPVTSANQLVAGKKYLFVGKYKTNSMSTARWATVMDYNSSKSCYNSIDVETTEVDNSLGVEVTEPETVVTFTLGGESDAWTFLGSDGKFMNLTNASNQVHQADEVTTDNQRWTVAIDATTSVATIKNKALTARMLWPNINSSKFACYGNTQSGNTFYLFVEKESSDPATTHTATFVNTDNWTDVYAYTWTGEVHQLGDWPGTKLEKSSTKVIYGVTYDVYTVSIDTEDAPEKIIFNNYSGAQTADLDFEDNKEYMGLTEPVAPAGWTVAGSADIFGTAWDLSATDNDMTEGDGNVWTLTKTDVQLSRGTYEYKVAKDHAWNESYPEQNAQITITEAGKYDITFTFNSDTKTVDAEATLTQSSEQTFTATFVNTDKWTDVYAYTWSAGTTAEIKQLGDWPGTKLEQSSTKEIYGETYDVYSVSIKDEAAPEKIIFNNGDNGEQTGDLVFKDNEEYMGLTVPQEPLGDVYYQKVTSTADITNGEYLIVYEGNDTHDAVAFNGGLGKLDAVSNNVAVSIIGDKIPQSETRDAALFTIDTTAGTLKSASGKYIGVSANSNGLKESEDATTYKNLFSIDEGNAVIKADFEDSNMTLRYNYANGQLRFRYYTSGQQPIALYKKVDPNAQPVTNTYTATFTTNAGWEKVYAYVFADNAPIDNVEWPGKEITSTLADGVYTYSAKLTKAPTGIVFNNGNSGEGNQTDDFDFVNGKAYELMIAEPTWTIAGSAKSLFGDHWWFGEEESSVNNLEKGDAHVWTKTYTNKLLTGVVYYGVFKNHGTDEYYPTGLNPDDLEGTAQQLTVDGVGYYDVTFTFNDETHALSAQATKKSDYTITSVVVNGNSSELFNGDLALEQTGEGVWTGTIKEKQLSAGKIDFGATINNENVLTPYGSLTITEAGKYDVAFTYTVATNKITAEATVWVEKPETYAIVGELTGGWNDAGTEPDVAVMTLQESGLYTYVVESFAAEAKTYQYKLRANNKWDVFELPASGNQEYTFNEAGNYKLTFTANVTGEAIGEVAAYTLTLVAEKIEEQPVEDTWTVAGAPATVFGSNWEPTDTNNDMVVQDDGSFKWEKTGITLPEGDVKFKVVKNHSWDEAYPEQDYVLAIEESAIYTISITFNPETKNVEATATKTGEATVESTYVLAGAVGDKGAGEEDVMFTTTWTVLDVNKMDKQDDDTYKKEYKDIVIPAETNVVKFKIVKNGTDWIGDPENKDQDYVVAVDAGATYDFTFTFNPETGVANCEANKHEAQQNTYTATFVNTGKWENVYAYAWYEAEAEEGLANLTAKWPGNKLDKVEGEGATKTIGEEVYDVYAFAINTALKPSYIIFNNGLDGEEKQQTSNLAFVNEQEYSYAVEPQPDEPTLTGISIKGGLNGDWDEGAFEWELSKSPVAGEYVLADQAVAANTQFKVLAKYSDNSTKWLSPESNGDFLVTEELLGTELALAENRPNMYFDKAGTFTFTVKADMSALTITGEFAEEPGPEPTGEIAYSWESPEGTPIETGGTIAHVNGTDDRLNFENYGYFTICLDGKKAYLNDEEASNNASHMEVTLDEPLCKGDVINITGFIVKDERKQSSAYIFFADGVDAESAAFDDTENLIRGGAIATKNVAVPDDAEGLKSFKMTRGTSGTNLYITKLTITRASQQEENTYTATFDNGGNWEEVYAYAWTDGEPVVEYLGAWPGTKLEKDGDVYAVSITAATAPEKIIFNNGKSGDDKVQTADLAFENGKAYTYTETPQPEYTSTATYAVQVDETHKAGETVDVQDGDEDVVATLTFGFAGGEDFKAGKAHDVLAEEGFVAYTEGNGQNGSATSGTNYIITPKYDGEITVGVALNANKAFYILEDDVALEDYNGIKVDTKYYGTYTFNVTANKVYKVYCAGSKLGFYGFNYSFNKAEPQPEEPTLTGVFIKGGLNGDWKEGAFEWELTTSATVADYVLADQAVAANTQFKVYAKYSDESVKWLSPESNGDFLVNADLLGTELALAEENPNMYFEKAGTFTFTVKNDLSALTITGEFTEEPGPELNTYTATFTTDVWDEVYAYVWSGEGENKVLGEWPGTKLEKNAETGLYDVEFRAEAAPEFIIFNNGNGGAGNQTDDLAFVDGQAYSYEPVEGDANLDGAVTTGDAVAAVSFALGTVEPSAAAFKAADVNKNNIITVSDAVGIVNIALGVPAPANDAKAFGYETNDYLTLNGQQLSLNNSTEFVAFQMDVTLTDGVLNGVELSQRANGLQVSTNQVGYNTWRIIAFSANKTIITGNEGNLLTIDANGPVSISNVEFADADARAYGMTVDDETTGINSIYGIDVENADIYSLGGQKLQKPVKGVNIINGKKVVVK